MPASQDRRARVATTTVFFATGLVVAAWATRIPAIQQRLGLSPGTFAVAVLGLEGGALVGLPVGGALVARLGSRRGLRLGFAVYPTALPAVALAPGLGWLVAALAVMAAANSVVDVAMSVQGVELERRYRRPILSSLHAAHPLGMLAGGLAGTAAAAADPPARSCCSGSSPSAPSCSTARPTTGPPPTCTASAGPARPWPPPASAPSRPPWPWAGWPATAWWPASAASGSSRPAAWVAAAGAALAVAAPTAIPSLLGWATLGAGLAAIAPAILGAVPAATRGPLPVAIAAATTLGYLGSFTGPPLIGAVAELTSLTRALGLLVVAALVPVLLARRALDPRAVGERQPSLR
jgi:hypothetical protein